ncbi:unnamed protein product, partial [Rotaria socialis]
LETILASSKFYFTRYKYLFISHRNSSYRSYQKYFAFVFFCIA